MVLALDLAVSIGYLIALMSWRYDVKSSGLLGIIYNSGAGRGDIYIY